MPRLFVGLALPGEAKTRIWAAFDDCRRSLPQAKWVPPENLHVTLKFLGAVPETAVSELCGSLSRVAGRHRPFSYELQGAGAFPSTRRGRVVWAGLLEPHEELVALQGDVDDALARLGFEPESRAYHPHVTLARLRVPQHVDGPIGMARCHEFEGIVIQAQELTLFESHLAPTGARYTRLAGFPLAAAQR